MAKKDLVAVQDPETGKFLPGQSGNPSGRPPGSKNRITLLKVALEEGIREETYDDIQKVLRLVIQQALDGDKTSQKMVWEASMSKGISPNEKEATNKKGFTVHHVHHKQLNDEEDDNG